MNNRKNAARSAAKFRMTIYLSILRVVCKWWLRTFQGWVTRSLGMTRCQVTFCNLLLCQRRSWWPKILKLGGWCKTTGAYNLYISDFSYWWPKVRSTLWPRHCTGWSSIIGKMLSTAWNRQISKYIHENNILSISHHQDISSQPLARWSHSPHRWPPWDRSRSTRVRMQPPIYIFSLFAPKSCVS